MLNLSAVSNSVSISDPRLSGRTQACLFRDNYSSITASGLSVYGLSTDSLKSNKAFVAKNNLKYRLLCDPSAKLISAIGLKRSPKGTIRGVIVIDKTGKVTAYEQGGPQRTVDVVMQVLSKEDAVSSVEAPAPDTVAANEGAASTEGDASMSGGVGATNVADEPSTGHTPEQNPQQGTEEQVKTAETAAEVADTAAEIDKHVELGPSA